MICVKASDEKEKEEWYKTRERTKKKQEIKEDMLWTTKV